MIHTEAEKSLITRIKLVALQSTSCARAYLSLYFYFICQVLLTESDQYGLKKKKGYLSECETLRLFRLLNYIILSLCLTCLILFSPDPVVVPFKDPSLIPPTPSPMRC